MISIQSELQETKDKVGQVKSQQHAILSSPANNPSMHIYRSPHFPCEQDDHKLFTCIKKVLHTYIQAYCIFNY